MAVNTRNTYTVLLFENAQDAGAEATLACLNDSGLRFELVKVKRLGEGLVRLKQRSVDVVLLDLNELNEEALEMITSVTALLSTGVLIVVGPGESSEAMSKAYDAGADEFLQRHELSPALLRQTIRYAVERWELFKGSLDHSPLALEDSDIAEVFHSLSDAILVLRKDYTIRFLNDAAAVLLESKEDALIGEVFPFSLESGGPGQLEIAGPHGTMRLFDLEVRDFSWRGEVGLLVVLRDITLSNRVKKEIASDEARLSILLESIKSGVIMTDAAGAVQRMNSEATRLTGLTIERAQNVSLENALWVKHPRTGRRVHNFDEVFLSPDYLSNPPAQGVELNSRDGQIFFVRLTMKKTDDVTTAHANSILVIRDMMLESGVELGRHEIEKLNAISLLASGIGHDFNNILSAVLGNISIARLGLGQTHDASKHLILAEKAALQARSLTKQLITFVKGGMPNLEATTLRSLVEDCSQFILRGSNVRCDLQIPEDLWPVEVDVGQISQVINNLIINADQAMPNGGVLHISLQNETITVPNTASLSEGKYVSLNFRDEGVGISAENQVRIFDPYFTTKENGNGLGLASCASILKSHRGAICVDSELGEGSTFRVYIPRAVGEVEIEAKEEIETELEVSDAGSGRILVMDDMEAMMMVAGEIIKTLGYDVGYATNGEEAIEAYKDAKESGCGYDAVVFDLTVPGGMGGEEACRILREYDPDLIAIASSGYTNSNVMDDFEAAGFKAVVPKPYRIKEMSAALSQVLGDAADE